MGAAVLERAGTGTTRSEATSEAASAGTTPDLVRFVRLPNGVVQVRLTEAARAGLASQERQQYADGVREAVLSRADEIGARRRWRAIARRPRVA